MNGAEFFEDFSDGVVSKGTRASTQDDALVGYESGYQAGWDDAVKAHQDAQTHLSTTLAQNLEQVEFTLVEAQTQLLATIKPVIEEITNTLLPGLVTEGLRALVLEEIEVLLKTNIANDISIVVSEQDEGTVSSFLNTSRNLSEITLIAKETLSEGQVYISCAAIQRKIDVTQAITDIQSRIDIFLDQPELERAVAR